MRTPLKTASVIVLAEPPLKLRNFWERVNKDGPIHPTKPELGNCWFWTGKIRSNGYGVVWNGAEQKELRVHRAVWFMEFGYTDLPILHSCDRPCCVNLAHLRADTIDSNNMESAIKLRKPRKLEPEDVLEIRRLRAEGWGVVALAVRFNMSIAGISRIYRGIHWKHLLPGFTPPD